MWLVDYVCWVLYDVGYVWVLLWVLVKNCWVRVFYECEGFVVEDDIKIFEIDGMLIEEVCYWCVLLKWL